MVRKNVSLADRDGLLAFPAPPGPAPGDPAPLVHWDFHTFNDTHLPPPSDEYKYVPVSCPLFKYEPDFEDVKQGDIGDCYLLSAINSMIRVKNANFFYEMIGVAADRLHVHVRFYVENAGAIVPVIVQVQRTILKKVNGDHVVDLQHHSAVWPYFVEKAYAFFRAYYLQPLLRQVQIKIPDPTKPQPALPPWPFDRATRPAPDPGHRYFVNYVEALKGGNCGRAYQHLTGEKTEDATADIEVPGPNGTVWMDMRDYRGALLRCVLDESLENPFAETWDATFDRFIGVLGRTVSGLTTSLAVPAVPVNDIVVRAAIKQHIADTRKANHSVVVDLIGMLDKKKKLMREVRSTDVRPFLARMVRMPVSLAASEMEDIDFGTLLLEFVRKSFPGKRGTGEYTDYHEALFTRLTAACTAQPPRAAFASTRNVLYILDLLDLGLDIYVTESQRKGLVPGHAYEISGTSKTTVRSAKGYVDLRFVLLRNPWGRYVRSYKIKFENVDGVDVVKSISANEGAEFADPPEDSLSILAAQGMGLMEMAEQMQALASQQVRRSPVFPVELSDITKFFDRVQLGV
ncbi:C2 family cysteine protease [Ancylobacter polymorphus]|uniref:C2 family cysteine protease n=1 Tax=Ancylobacter polymorphus TaxID=223390 RepID=A0A9E6ZSX2_9HYPH|nr:C2 family cysteine protease [Ancylobacter polymorphus]UOK69467.1 C2 family cysteine protease [Ancylobacter polymorphus]